MGLATDKFGWRGFCEHGKVMELLADMSDDPDPNRRRYFRNEKAKMARWAHKLDRVSDLQA